MKSVVDDLGDAFRVSDLDDSALSGDPARLSDEAAAISMLGGRRVVRVRGAGNNLAKLFDAFLADPKGDALVVVEGGDLAKGTGLRKVFEEADNACAIACYPDTARDLFRRRAQCAEGGGPFHRARRAGRRGKPARLGPRRHAARAREARALHARQEAGDA